jgi:hypothetical protein
MHGRVDGSASQNKSSTRFLIITRFEEKLGNRLSPHVLELNLLL